MENMPTHAACQSIRFLAALSLLSTAAGEALPVEKPAPETLIVAIEKAPRGERPRFIQELSLLGPPALEATRKARDGAGDPELKRAFARAATWQLVAKISPVLAEGFKSQLTYDGQFSSLKDEGPEVIDALLALAEDAAGEPGLRISAFRAIADVAGARGGGRAALKGAGAPEAPREGNPPEILSRARKVYHDPLLPEALKEQAGFLLAIFGDTHAVDSRIARFERLAKSEDPIESNDSYVELAQLYYRMRDYEKAVKCYDRILDFYDKVIEIQKKRKAPREDIAKWRKVLALQCYNAACSTALAGQIEKSKELLRKAVEIDPTHYTNMEKDGDLIQLRSDPGYATFREELGKLFDKEEI